MSRYIDADNALRMMRNSKQDNPCDTQNKGVWKIAHDCCISCLDAAPTADVVEVVRCEDCVYCRYVDGADIYKCDRRGYYSEEVKPTDYCSRGERGSENEG